MKPFIVLIDDSQYILDFLANYLNKRFEVMTYTKGSEAINDIASCKINPDVVVTDFNMPNDYSGIRVLEELGEIGNVPSIVLSGSCDIHEKIRCINIGAQDFVEKPFNPRELEARINRVLARMQSENTLAYAS